VAESRSSRPPAAKRTAAGSKSGKPEVATRAEHEDAGDGALESELGATIATVREMAAAEAAERTPRAVGDAAAESNVTDELSGGGVAFGEFVKSVGLSVAAAQAELDKTLRETAKQLSETKIDVIAVFEQQIKDDDGTMDKGNIHMQELPLINYLMPTAYHWSRVYLEADMNVQEFNSRAGFNIQQRAFSASANVSGSVGLFGAGFSGSAGTSFSTSNTGVDASTSTDTAAGKLHMEATLEPRSDIELPRPFVLQKGPRLEVLVGARTEVHQDGDPTKPVTAQKVTLTAVLKTSKGEAHANKNLAISISNPTLNYTSSGKTDNSGEMTIELTRKVLPDQDKPVEAAVRVSFGLVTATAGVAI